MTVTDTLQRGRDNVLSSYAIARELGVPQRQVGFLVSDERRAGQLIGSVHGEGYYLIDNEAELLDTINHIEHRKVGIDRTVRALREAWACG